MNLVSTSPQQDLVPGTPTAHQRREGDTSDTLFAHEFMADPETPAVASLEQSSKLLLALSRALGIAAPDTASPVSRTIVTEEVV